MPLVTIKVFKDELSDSQAKDLIHKVTETVIPFVGERLPDNTWVLIEEIASGILGNWRKAFAWIAGHSSVAISARYVHPSEDSVWRPWKGWVGTKLGTLKKRTKTQLFPRSS